MNRDRLSSFIFPLLGCLLLVFSGYILSDQLNRYKLGDILASLASISQQQITYAIILTIVEYLVISSYDIVSFAHLKYRLPIGRILFTSFVTYAISNTTGFTLFIGSGIRYRFYSFWGVPGKDIAKIIALGNLTFCLGLLTLDGITFLINPLQLPGALKFDLVIMRCFGIFLISILSIYLYFCARRKRIKIKKQTYLFPRLSTSISQIILFSLDWAIAAAILYCLIPHYSNQTYPNFLGIYLLAMTASIISNVPGGIGVFESIIIYLLPRDLSAANILGSLLAYRGIRFFLPLLTAIIFICYFEIQRKFIISR